MFRLAHIINPVVVGESSDLYAAQPVTFESMRLAQVYAGGNVDVKLYSAQFAEDAKLVPPWITSTPDLNRSVLDVGGFQVQRKLPLLKDILDRLYETSDADYFIYTNVDIALMPHFYTAVAQLIDSGIDAMVINRRTIARTPNRPAQLPLMWAQVGEKHLGHDCFVFSRELLPKFSLGQVCLGAAWVGRVLIWNLCFYAKKFQEFKDLHLTFHLGNDKIWRDQKYADYENHNRMQASAVLGHIINRYGSSVETSAIRSYLSPDPRLTPGTKDAPELKRREKSGLLTRFFTRRN